MYCPNCNNNKLTHEIPNFSSEVDETFKCENCKTIFTIHKEE